MSRRRNKKYSKELKIKAVEEFLEGKGSQLEICRKYGISYQQIYSWVRKYEEKGVDGLADGRGRTKPVEEMTEAEKLRAENRILQARNYDLEMENAFIKKLKELEEGGR